ncbi:hypothetical protein AciX9_3165 [Granulicella tundricola MP5ACTX9]|uniref:Uncharacterized protein n=1 Tax=Granulicella tundricola (strain ATCC BAA-1859 / DSM 23138 / MP5ACTX9) TaxID=1198114 RepID=E8X0Z2_GRATM|nr:hypothetical protein AciX9_3165 [Granulicella tundricola MP5ACTX9]
MKDYRVQPQPNSEETSLSTSVRLRVSETTQLVDLINTAFEGIPKWDAFAQHYGGCELCNT